MVTVLRRQQTLPTLFIAIPGQASHSSSSIMRPSCLFPNPVYLLGWVPGINLAGKLQGARQAPRSRLSSTLKLLSLLREEGNGGEQSGI